jgi:lysophospholipase L1-like esterase
VHSRARRRWTAWAACTLLPAFTLKKAQAARGMTLFTFGDSVLDCGRYNAYGITPGALLVRNDDRLFPEFAGRDLRSRGAARLEHHAVDGATVDDLRAQAARLAVPGGRVAALVTIGGNDLLRGLAADDGRGMRKFETALARFLQGLRIRPVLLGNVYDPTFGDDARKFLPIDATKARANHARVNAIIAKLALRHGRLVDLHAHFLLGNDTWFVDTIEPSLIGASEVRRAFLAAL